MSIRNALKDRNWSFYAIYEQFRIIVLIAIIVIARKVILLDYNAATLETFLGLGGLALCLGGLYWLIGEGEQRRRSGNPQ